jgi:carbon starvation protein
MPLSAIGVAVLVIFAAAYAFYGRFLARSFVLDDARETPAHRLRDGNDFIPTPFFPLLAQHFSAISAAGPIVGPILAGLLFGWVPGLIWILVGCVFIGAAHDFASLVGSIRHDARSVAEILREHVGTTAFVLVLAFIWLALVLASSTSLDVTARAFVRGASYRRSDGHAWSEASRHRHCSICCSPRRGPMRVFPSRDRQDAGRSRLR